MTTTISTDHGLTLTLASCHLFLGHTVDLISRYEKLYAVLSADEKQKAISFKFEKDRLLYVIAHGTLKEVMASYLQVDPATLKFKTDDFGKPFLSIGSLPHQLQFSLSHSGKTFLFAFNWGEPIGADVETIVQGQDYSAIVQNYFSKGERQQLATSSSKENLFYQLWTQKEAIGKVFGLGITDIKKISLPERYQLYSSFVNHACYSICFPMDKEIKIFQLSS